MGDQERAVAGKGKGSGVEGKRAVERGRKFIRRRGERNGRRRKGSGKGEGKGETAGRRGGKVSIEGKGKGTVEWKRKVEREGEGMIKKVMGQR